MVRISAFPKCWLEDIVSGQMDLFEWIDISETLDCEGLELYYKFLASTDEAYLFRVRQAVEKTGKVVSMMCYSPDFTKPVPSERHMEVENQILAVKTASVLGARYCRVLSGQKRPEVAVEDGIAWVCECIKECMILTAGIDVELVIENHFKDGYWLYPEFAQKSEVFLRILELLPDLGVQFDPSNSIVAGEDPLVLLDKIAAKVKTVHASDRRLAPNVKMEDLKQAEGVAGYAGLLTHGVVGEGLNDYDKIFDKLNEAGFNGWISIEDGMNGLDEMKRSIDYLNRMRNKHNM